MVRTHARTNKQTNTHTHTHTHAHAHPLPFVHLPFHRRVIISHNLICAQVFNFNSNTQIFSCDSFPPVRHTKGSVATEGNNMTMTLSSEAVPCLTTARGCVVWWHNLPLSGEAPPPTQLQFSTAPDKRTVTIPLPSIGSLAVASIGEDHRSLSLSLSLSLSHTHTHTHTYTHNLTHTHTHSLSISLSLSLFLSFFLSFSFCCSFFLPPARTGSSWIDPTLTLPRALSLACFRSAWGRGRPCSSCAPPPRFRTPQDCHPVARSPCGSTV